MSAKVAGWRKIRLFIVIAILFSSPAYAAVASQDDEIANAVVGIWIRDVSHTSDVSYNLQRLHIHYLADFNADGSGVLQTWSDSCKFVITATPFSWTIKKGVLETKIRGHNTIRDEIMDMGPKSMQVRLISHGDDRPLSFLEYMVRARDCLTPE